MNDHSRAAFLGAAGALAFAPLAAGAQQLITIRGTTAIDDPATPYLYAIQSGLFKKNGIDATVERSTSGAAATSAVVGGSFEVGKASTVSFMNAFARGLPIIAIAPAGEFDPARPNAHLCVKPDAPIKTGGADLNGKTVAVSALNDIFTLAVKAWVDQHGGDSSTIKLTEVPISSAVEAVASGRIDAAVVIEPFLAQAIAAKQVRSLGDVVESLGTHHIDSLWFTRVAYTQQQPDAVNRFIRVMREAAIYVNAHPVETAPILVEFAKVQTKDVGKVRVLQGVKLDPALLQPTLDAAFKYGMIPKHIDAKDMIYSGALR